MLRTHSVLVVPAHGHCDADGRYDHGRRYGRFSQMDVVDGYMHSLIDELDGDGVRHEVMPTRTHPGVCAQDRPRFVEANHLVLHLCAGFSQDPPKTKNMTSVYYGSPQARDIAEEISEAIAEWGHCYVWGHKTANPQLSSDPLLQVKGSLGVRIEPFVLNGPDSDLYLAKLPQLGTCIGRALVGYLTHRGHARARGVVTLA